MLSASAWSTWETATSKLLVDPEYIKQVEDPKWSVTSPVYIARFLTTIFIRALAFARIECHFFVNGGFMRDGQLIEEAYKIKHLPIIIIQGRYDVVCPAKTSWDLYQSLGGKDNRNVEYLKIGDVGHSAH